MSRPDSESRQPAPAVELPPEPVDRRAFLVKSLPAAVALVTLQGGQEQPKPAPEASPDTGPPEPAYKASDHMYAMGVDLARCIGCGRCVEACKTENDVPREPYYFRTWVERYVLQTNGDVAVSSPDGGIAGFPPIKESGILRTFFVPKLCNQCDHAPCVQVCPVGATFITQDGVVLVDDSYCIGCRYCIQACPYGARFLHPVTHVAEKCTFCYHRLVQQLSPACVEVCPTQARIFGDLKARGSPLSRFRRTNEIHVLKPNLNTEPKVYYANMDGEVS